MKTEEHLIMRQTNSVYNGHQLNEQAMVERCSMGVLGCIKDNVAYVR